MKRGGGRGRKTLWRAMNMGMHHAEHRTWRDALSDRLMDMAQRPKGSVGFLLSDAGCEGGRDGERVTVGKVGTMRLNNGMLDIVFANQYGPEMCKELEKLFNRR